MKRLLLFVVFFSVFWGTESCKGKDSYEFPIAIFNQNVFFYNDTPENSASPYNAPLVDSYVQPPATFGNLVPEAFLKVESANVSRYDDLEIIFSHSMDPATVIALLGGTDSFILTDSLGNKVGGRIFWFGSKKLYFDPYKELKSFEEYTLVISSDAKTTGAVPLKPYLRKFTTRPGFIFNLSLSGTSDGTNFTTVTVGADNGVIFDSTTHPFVRLNLGVNHNTEISYLKLCKLSVGAENSTGSPVRCRTEYIRPDIDLSDPGLTLCSNTCPASLQIWLGDSGALDGLSFLTQDYLKLKKGANNYFIEVADKKGIITYKNFTLYWAPTHPETNYITLI